MAESAHPFQTALSAPIEVNGAEHIVTTSIGIAYATASPVRDAGTATPNEILQDADAAMYCHVLLRSTDPRFGYIAGIAIEGISWR